MAVESKPLFHPEVIRQQVRSFDLPDRVADWQPKLQHWAGLIASGRADDFKETALLPDFLTDILCELSGYHMQKPSNKLLAVAELDSDTWVGEVKCIRGKKLPLTSAEVQGLRE